MCGIYGITENNREFIEKYIDICSYRGPDGRGIYNDNFITLGHNLLSITDNPKVSQQPWKTPAGNILVYNGEIFNYFELLERYSAFIPKTTCDTELLAWGLDTYGLNFIDQIDSMHGFAYYNPNKKELVLSRDHAGIKPVFYAEINQGLVFGSEIKGMLDIVPGSRTIDNLSLSLMTQIGINVSNHTFYSGIKKLLSGETIVYDIANKRIKSKPKETRQYTCLECSKIFNKLEFCHHPLKGKPFCTQSCAARNTAKNNIKNSQK
jgi:asparagine synthase (glutamine-hydrolysing)